MEDVYYQNEPLGRKHLMMPLTRLVDQYSSDESDNEWYPQAKRRRELATRMTIHPMSSENSMSSFASGVSESNNVACGENSCEAIMAPSEWQAATQTDNNDASGEYSVIVIEDDDEVESWSQNMDEESEEKEIQQNVDATQTEKEIVAPLTFPKIRLVFKEPCEEEVVEVRRRSLRSWRVKKVDTPNQFMAEISVSPLDDTRIYISFPIVPPNFDQQPRRWEVIFGSMLPYFRAFRRERKSTRFEAQYSFQLSPLGMTQFGNSRKYAVRQLAPPLYFTL